MPAELFAAAVLTVYGAQILKFLTEEQTPPPSRTVVHPVKTPADNTIVIPGDAVLARTLSRQMQAAEEE